MCTKMNFIKINIWVLKLRTFTLSFKAYEAKNHYAIIKYTE